MQIDSPCEKKQQYRTVPNRLTRRFSFTKSPQYRWFVHVRRNTLFNVLGVLVFYILFRVEETSNTVFEWVSEQKNPIVVMFLF